MDAKKVMEVLAISRPDLRRCRNKKLLKYTPITHKTFDYDELSVYFYKQTHKKDRITAIYGRVTTSDQKDALESQINKLMNYAKQKKYQNIKVFRDVASGISFSDQTDFSKLFNLVLNGEVKRILILSQDRLSQNNYQFLKSLFQKYNTKIIRLTRRVDTTDSQIEIPYEMVDLFQHLPITFSQRKGINKNEKDSEEKINHRNEAKS